MSKTKATHQDLTDYENPVDTGNPHAKRPADKKVAGDKAADTSASAPVTVMPFQKVAEDISAMFKEVEGLSEGFGAQVAKKIEEALEAHAVTIREAVEAEYAGQFETALAEATEELAERVDAYLSHGMREFIKENAVAIDAGIKNDISEQILESVTDIIETAGVVLPEDKVDIAEELATELAEMEKRLDAKIEENLQLRGEVIAEQVKVIGIELTEGMTAATKDKFLALTETISYADAEDYRAKMTTLKENFAGDVVVAEAVVEDKSLNLVEAMQAQPLNESVDAPAAPAAPKSRFSSYI